MREFRAILATCKCEEVWLREDRKTRGFSLALPSSNRSVHETLESSIAANFPVEDDAPFGQGSLLVAAGTRLICPVIDCQ
jgi:hypothetical protein